MVCLLSLGLAGERGAQGRRHLGRPAVEHDDDGHRAFNRQLAVGVEDLVVVAYGRAAEPARGEPQAERRVEREDAREAAFEVDAREVVALSLVEREAEPAQEVGLGLLDYLEDAREVQAAGRVGVGPAQASLVLDEGRGHLSGSARSPSEKLRGAAAGAAPLSL